MDFARFLMTGAIVRFTTLCGKKLQAKPHLLTNVALINFKIIND